PARGAPSRRWARAYRRAGTQALQPVDDDLLAAREPLIDDDACAALGTGFHAPHDGFAVLHHEHVDALLIGKQRGLRDDDLFLRGADLETDPHELTVDDRAVGVGH